MASEHRWRLAIADPSAVILRNVLRAVDALPALNILGVVLIAYSPERARRGDRHTFTVSSIVEGSPADTVGIQRGDVIVSVDGRPASHLRAKELRELSRIDGRNVRLGIRRGDDILEKVIVLKPIL